MKEQIRDILMDTGAIKVGFADAREIETSIQKYYDAWLKLNNQAGMKYLERHASLKKDSSNILKGARTVITLAFSYAPVETDTIQDSTIATYAKGEDYHIVIREIINPVISLLKSRFGGEWRLCIDSAPVFERYFAIKSGIGKRGLNGNIIVEGCGSYCYLAEIFTTLEIESDSENSDSCIQCGLCIENCPGKALHGDGTMNAARCINYLTIEKKGEFSKEEIDILSNKNGTALFGCDTCIKVCPHNKNVHPTEIEAFRLSELTREISAEKIINMNEKELKRKLARSPLLYAGYQRLVRNATIVQQLSKKQE